MPLPRGYIGLIVCDEARAHRWTQGLAAKGFTVAMVDAVGEDADKGDYQIGVVRVDEVNARNWMTSVLQGREQLPSAPLWAGWSWKIAVSLVLVAALVMGLLTLR
jgi:hypothetical protein